MPIRLSNRINCKHLRCTRSHKSKNGFRLRKCNRAISSETFQFQSMPKHACPNPQILCPMCKVLAKRVRLQYALSRNARIHNLCTMLCASNVGCRLYIYPLGRRSNLMFAPYFVCIAFCGEIFLRVFFQQLSQLVGVLFPRIILPFSENTRRQSAFWLRWWCWHVAALFISNCNNNDVMMGTESAEKKTTTGERKKLCRASQNIRKCCRNTLVNFLFLGWVDRLCLCAPFEHTIYGAC